MEINSRDALLNALNGFGSSNSRNSDVKQTKELGQAQFFELMLAQMKNQDPTKPLDGQEYLGQLAQFSTVNGIQQLQSSFNQLSLSLQSMQALQASSLVGRSVIVDSDTVHLTPGEAVHGRVELPQDVKDLTVVVLDASGQEIRQIKLGDPSPGSTAFSWDGADEYGNAVVPGNYQLRIEGSLNGTKQTFAAQVQATVESVSVGSGVQGMVINLAGLGEYPIDRIQEIL